MAAITPNDAALVKQRAARANQADSRAQEQAIRDVLERERNEYGKIASTDEPTEPEDAVAIAQFIGGLRHQREQAGMSLGDLADRSGMDKATLSRLENGWYPNPTINTLARYARGIGKRLILDLED
jgi:ribosome-binding protein aMBF1 (putative translation factor)